MSDLTVRLPDSLRAERRYAVHVVLALGLGLSFDVIFEARDDIVVHAAGDAGRTLRMPDTVMRSGERNWPHAATRPTIRSTASIDEPHAEDGHIHFDVDVFGTAFWYLARVEEFLSAARDQHGRFPAEASSDESQRPVVDELTDSFGKLLQRLWPDLAPRRHVFRMSPTHDVDRPFKHLFQTPRALLKGMVRETLRGGSVMGALQSPMLRRRVLQGQVDRDPFNTFDWLMDRSERSGLQSTFYFICVDTPGGLNGDYRADDPAIRALLRRIHARGHLIGLHGSYWSATDATRLTGEVQRLRSLCAAEGIELDRIRLRQHVLRFEPQHTIEVWAAAGIDEDSTLGHAGRAGFRCGTCRGFPLFDLRKRQLTSILERPLIAMDASLLDPAYEGLSPVDAGARLDELRRLCSSVGGDFVLLWHNCRLESEASRRLYAKAVSRPDPVLPDH